MALSRGEAPQHLLRGGHAGVVAAARLSRHLEVPLADRSKHRGAHHLARCGQPVRKHQWGRLRCRPCLRHPVQSCAGYIGVADKSLGIAGHRLRIASHLRRWRLRCRWPRWIRCRRASLTQSGAPACIWSHGLRKRTEVAARVRKVQCRRQAQKCGVSFGRGWPLRLIRLEAGVGQRLAARLQGAALRPGRRGLPQPTERPGNACTLTGLRPYARAHEGDQVAEGVHVRGALHGHPAAAHLWRRNAV
mmetsp:Transcript_73232/g.202106  ORF Transcript_73232/g.202106 Transcript_73232/m.202106 type:complete len:247 (+) Transcript_73232:294-1034(+)